MAKGVYIGDSTSKARKVKKMYYGVGNLARTVKKGYIGIGGVARPFWSGGGKPVYYGSISSLPNALEYAKGINNKNFALIAGGRNIDTDQILADVTAYDKNLIRNVSATLRIGAYSVQTGKTENHAIAAGGVNASYDDIATVNAYDGDLIRYSPSDLRQVSYSDGCGSIGEYAVFAASNRSPNQRLVTAYDDELVRSSPPDLLFDHSNCASYNHNYLLFSGGGSMGGGINVTAYDSLLVRFSAPDLLTSLAGPEGGCRAGNYALFFLIDKFCVYDETLIESTIPSLNGTSDDSNRVLCGISTLGDCAIFAGGGDGNGWNPVNLASTIDADLIKTDLTPISVARVFVTGAVIDEYAIFAGGRAGSGSWNLHDVSTVDCYMLV